MLFLFVEHAFDVGDLLEVELMTYRVKKIDLMYTVCCVCRVCGVRDCWRQQQQQPQATVRAHLYVLAHNMHVHAQRITATCAQPTQPQAHCVCMYVCVSPVPPGAGEEHWRALLLPQHAPHHPASGQPHTQRGTL